MATQATWKPSTGHGEVDTQARKVLPGRQPVIGTTVTMVVRG